MPESEQESPQEIISVEPEESVPVVKAVPAPAPPPPEKPSHQPAGPSGLGRFIKGFLFFLLRLTVILLLLGVLAVSIAYLAPLVYERFVRPVEINAAQVAALGTQQAESAAQIASLQTRLATAEAKNAQQIETFTNLTGRVQTIEDDLAEHTQQLAALNEMQSELIKANEGSLSKMNNQIEQLKALEMLARARLFLYQSNFGLARQDVQSARDILASLQEKAPAPELSEAIFRLDLVLKNLPSFPVPASNDLDQAWLVLVQGLPAGTPTPGDSATAMPIPTESATPTPEVGFTPTPVPPTKAPTATP